MIDRGAQSAQRAIAARHVCDASVCPDADTLIAFADGRLEPAARNYVASRVAACPTCAAAVRAALDAKAWANDVAADLEPAPITGNVHELKPPVHVRRRVAWLPLAMAAGVTLMVGIGALMQRLPVEETLRGSPALTTYPADGVVLTDAPARLTWPCNAAAATARTQLLRADATVLWSGPATACGTTLPSAARAAMVPGEYLWRVQDAAGESLLGPYGFRIAP